MASVSPTGSTSRPVGETTKGARCDQLLEAGLELFSQGHYVEVSVADVAARAQVAHGLLFHYFGSKRNFFRCVLEYAAADGRARYHQNTDPRPDVWLSNELDIFLEMVAAHDQIFLRLIRGSLGAEAEVTDFVTTFRDFTAQRLLERLQPEQTSDLLVTAITAWVAGAGELSARWVESGREVPQSQLRNLLIDSLNAALQTLAIVDDSVRFDPERFGRI